MGIMHRLGQMVSATGNALQAPLGFAADVATAPWRDDEVGGITNYFGHVTKKRGSQAIQGAFGKNSVGGTAADAGLWGIKTVGKGLDVAYKYSVSRPLTTVITAGNLTSGGGEFNPNDDFYNYKPFFSGDVWKKAWDISEHSSPGRAMAQNEQIQQDYHDNKDPLDVQNPDEIAEIAGTQRYKLTSGASDAFSRIFLDPTVVGGKVMKAAKGVEFARDVVRGDEAIKAGAVADEAGNAEKAVGLPKLISKTIDTPEQRNQFIGSTAYTKFRDDTLGMDSKDIFNRYFKKDTYGSEMSALLASAKDGEQHALLTKAMMGDGEAVGQLRDNHVALMNQLQRATGERNAILSRNNSLDGPYAQQQLFGGPQVDDKQNIDLLTKELKSYEGERGLGQSILENGNAPLRQIPSYTALQSGKTAVTEAFMNKPTDAGVLRQTVWQYNPLGVIFRKDNTWAPGGESGMVNLHSPGSSVDFQRFIDKIGGKEQAVSIRDKDSFSYQGVFTDERKKELMAQYMAAPDDVSRGQAWRDVEQEAIKALAKKHGIDDVGLVEKLGNAGRRGRVASDKMLNNDRIFDAPGRSTAAYHDAETDQLVHVPLFNSQHENVHSVVNLDILERGIKDIGSWRSRYKNIDEALNVPSALINGYQRVWKPFTLARLGYPVRNVSEGQLRIWSKIGAMAQSKNVARASGHFIQDKFIKKIPDELRVPGTRKWNYNGFQMPGAFADYPGDAKNMYASLNSSNGMSSMLGGDEARVMEKLRGGTKDGRPGAGWTTIEPTKDPIAHGVAWTRDLNKQIGKDEMGRKFLQGESPEDVAKWLTDTPEGQAYSARNKARASDPLSWARDAEDQVKRYSMDEPEIKQKALAGTLTPDDLSRLRPDANTRPPVHGEILRQSFGHGPEGVISQIWDKTVSGFYNFAADRPERFFSRNPYFDSVYRAEMKRLVDLHDGPLDNAAIEKLATPAREHALAETNRLLFNQADKSDLEGMMRNIMPFYSAWREVATRWGGIAMDNPAYVARVAQAWQAPERMGIVTDEKGSQVHDDGNATDINGNPTKAGKDRYINLNLVPGVKHLPGFDVWAQGGTVQINKKSLNILLNGPPGVGPVVQVPVNEIAKHAPELQSSLKWALPFGATDDVKQLLIPAGPRKVLETSNGEQDENFTTRTNAILRDETVKYNLGHRDTAPTLQEAMDKAKTMGHISLLSQYILPFQSRVVSPYQPFLDSLRAARERQSKDQWALGSNVEPDGKVTPKSPDQWFYETMGPEFFPMAQSMTKSMNGVPPTIEGMRAGNKYKDLIEEASQYGLGGFVIGEEGDGAFVSSVYNAQKDAALKSGSKDKQREVLSPEEYQNALQAKQGWMEYSQFMDLLESERINRGLTSLNVKKAADLADIKKTFVDTMRADPRYAGWAKDYDQNDTAAAQNKIEFLRKVASDKRMQGRDSVDGLNQYLVLRDQVSAELNSRRNATIKVDGKKKKAGVSLEGNPDIKEMWDAGVGDILESNLDFSKMYYRYLENDSPVAPSQMPSEKYKKKKSSGGGLGFGTKGGF